MRSSKYRASSQNPKLSEDLEFDFKGNSPYMELFNEYKKYIPGIVNRIVRHLPPSVSKDDLTNVGLIGLMDAIKRYEPERDNKFMTYAIFRIKGAILSELRKRDFLKRTTRKNVKNYEKTKLCLERVLGRNAKEDEIAKEMGISLERLWEIKKNSTISLVNIEEMPYDTKDNRLNPLEKLCKEEEKMILKKAIDSLNEKQKQVIKMYYQDGLPMRKIGENLGCTESNICQIHSMAINNLRLKMNNFYNKKGKPKKIDDKGMGESEVIEKISLPKSKKKKVHTKKKLEKAKTKTEKKKLKIKKSLMNLLRELDRYNDPYY